MNRLIWRLRLALFRYRTPPTHDANPNFLFSTWPQVERHDGIWQVAISPSGEDDQPQMQAAVNRLSAIGGGTMRLTAGDYRSGGTVWMPE